MKRVAILILSVLFSGLFIGSVYAKEGVEPSPFNEKGFAPQPEPPRVYKPIQPSKSADTKQFPAIRLEDAKIMEQPSIKRSLNIGVKSLHVVPKPDLTCTIKAFHDVNRTKPVQGGVWHMSYNYYSPPIEPLPWFVYFDVEVKNIGWENANNSTVRIVAFDPFTSPWLYDKVVSLSPGEAEIFQLYWGAFTPGKVGLYNKTVTLSAAVDTPSKIDEISESNNSCSLTVQFVNP